MECLSYDEESHFQNAELRYPKALELIIVTFKYTPPSSPSRLLVCINVYWACHFRLEAQSQSEVFFYIPFVVVVIILISRFFITFRISVVTKQKKSCLLSPKQPFLCLFKSTHNNVSSGFSFLRTRNRKYTLVVFLH